MENVCGRYAQNVTKTEQSFKKQKQTRLSRKKVVTPQNLKTEKSKKRLGIFIIDQTNILIIWKQNLG
jgi:hypothetical protein